ncbi:hypothetical protein, partial [Winslowiella iniecta]|uniref:hypothetical protein n=1 Tax=Winslowiella iniecta TaxID=1560201 RepID=UPI0019D3A5C5
MTNPSKKNDFVTEQSKKTLRKSLKRGYYLIWDMTTSRTLREDGGGGEIRTLERFPVAGFQDR